MGKSESPDEAFARVAVQRATGAVVDHFDTGTLPGAVDFLIRYEDGRTGALEVTSVSGPGEQAMVSELADINHALPPHPGQFPWSIRVTSRTSMKKLKAHYVTTILFFEGIGISRSSAVPYGVRIPSEVGALLRSGASFSQSSTEPLAPDDRPPVYVWPDVRAGFVRDDLDGLPDDLEAAFEVPHVQLRLDKVCARPERERHLFIWFGPNGLSFPTDYSMTKRLGTPSRDPRCPPRLTHLWVTTPYAPVLMGWSRDGGWSSYDVYDTETSAI